MKRLTLILLLFISSLSLKSYSQGIDTTIQQDVNKRLVQGLQSKELLCICEKQVETNKQVISLLKFDNESQKQTISEMSAVNKDCAKENTSLKQSLATETRNKRIWQITSGVLVGVIILIK